MWRREGVKKKVGMEKDCEARRVQKGGDGKGFW